MAHVSDPQAQFWQWFRDNGARLRAIMYGPDEDAREEAAEELREAIADVESGLVLEFGPASMEEMCELIVSADSQRELVDAVKDFVASAPALPGWRVVAFRPRLPIGESVAIRLDDEEIGPEDLWFRIEPGDDGLDMTLYVRGLTSDNEQIRGLGAMLLTEHSVGEEDALTLLASLDIDVLPDDPAAEGLQPFGDLVAIFDEAKGEKYPPVGLLPLDPEGQWEELRGSIDGVNAVVLLNAGLQDLAGHPAYDRRLTVRVPFDDADDDGMPDPETEAIVDEIGDRVREALEEDQESLLATRITMQGHTDLVLYTSDLESALKRIKDVRREVAPHRLETSVERDTFWEMYRAFVEGAQEGEDEEEEPLA